MRLQKVIEQHWYQETNFRLALFLWPLSLIYRLISAIRKQAFRIGLFKSYKLRVPVVIIGNISVGGAGKTPLCKYLAGELTTQGYQVGIILRGYKGSNKQPRLVNADDDSSQVGDEALIYANAGFRVAIGANRVEAGELLLDNYPTTQLILADDGLQHYRLQRDLEICVVDSSRLFGNQQVLPMGPLRESMSRLKTVGAIVINGNNNQQAQQELSAKLSQPVYQQELIFQNFYNPRTGDITTVSQLNAAEPEVIAAIGNPERFFAYLSALGLQSHAETPFPDHYYYQLSDINPKCAIITTEKDFTKLKKFKLSNIWITQVSAKLNNSDLINTIKKLIC